MHAADQRRQLLGRNLVMTRVRGDDLGGEAKQAGGWQCRRGSVIAGQGGSVRVGLGPHYRIALSGAQDPETANARQPLSVRPLLTTHLRLRGTLSRPRDFPSREGMLGPEDATMADLRNTGTEPGLTTAGSDSSADRRRPGRPESVHPVLIPLLREPHDPTDALSIGQVFENTTRDTAAAEGLPALASTRDDLGLVRGIAVALLLMLPFWCAVAFFALR
jgi:hypothetical protein